jgi:hypothetical protein
MLYRLYMPLSGTVGPADVGLMNAIDRLNVGLTSLSDVACMHRSFCHPACYTGDP